MEIVILQIVTDRIKQHTLPYSADTSELVELLLTLASSEPECLDPSASEAASGISELRSLKMSPAPS